MTEWKASPALAREAGSRIIDGTGTGFGSNGFVAKFGPDGKARIVRNGEAVTKEAIALSRKHRRYKRTRSRKDGSVKQDYGQYKHGLCSIVTTVAPWMVPCFRRMSAGEREDVLLRMGETQARVVMEISKRPTHSFGAHTDTAVPHLHSMIFKTSPAAPGEKAGEKYDKKDFLSMSPWMVGAMRINGQFPGLLDEDDERMMRENLAKHDSRPRIQWEVAKAVDAELETYITERGWWREYQQDRKKYELRKRCMQEAEKERGLVEEIWRQFKRTGRWKLAWREMTKDTWRLIPREYHRDVKDAIRLRQVVRRPIRVAERAIPEAVKASLTKDRNEMALKKIGVMTMPH